MTSAPNGRRPTAAVVVCTYSLDRLSDLDACLDGIEHQDVPPRETIVVVDHNPALQARIRPGVATIPNGGPRGLSSARNTGLAATDADVVAFIDDDAVPDRRWLHELLRPFDDPKVAAVGGRIEPDWPDDRPDWFPPHLDWTVGCTNPGLPADGGSIRNVFGASAAFRRDALERVGGFPVDMGRVGGDVAGCEETQVCIRIRQTGGDDVHYAPRSFVRHRVTPARASVRYVLRRCLGEGRSKARLARTVGDDDATSDERAYVADILGALVRDAAGAVRRPRRLLRAGVLFAGLVCASIGYGAELIRSRWGTAWD